MISIFLKILMLLWGVWHSFLYSEMQIEITHGINTAHPIAVIPFTYINHNNVLLRSSSIIEDCTSIITNDLRNSGKFSIFPASRIPSHQPTKASDLIPMFWEKLGINTVILGTINTYNNENYIISYQLVDISNNCATVILENQYSVEIEKLRHTAHTISNEIFKKLIGIQGIFCTRIAYVTRVNNRMYPYELCISDYDGYNQISVCQSSEPLMSPAWSPDGKKIAYVTFASGSSALVIQTLNTGFIRNITNFPQHNGAPAWSPDGKKIAFSSSKTGSLNLYVINLISGEIKQLTNNRNNNTEPHWFPDNKNLAYTSDQGGNPQVYKINTETVEIKRLSWLHGNNQHPNVSTDGTFIIMVNSAQGKQNIAKLNLLTGHEKILTNTILSDTPSISPNNIMILYSSITEKHRTSTLELISADGNFSAHLQGLTGDIRFPTWSNFCCITAYKNF